MTGRRHYGRGGSFELAPSYHDYAEGSAIRQVAIARARAIVSGTRSRLSAAPCIVKNIPPGARSIERVRDLVKYVARIDERLNKTEDDPAPRDSRPVELFDQWGSLVMSTSGSEQERAAHIKDLVDAWELLSDEKNLKPALRGQSRRAAQAAGTSRTGRLKHAQAFHMIISAPERAPGDRASIEAATAATIRQTFGRWQYKVIWGLHDSETPSAAGRPKRPKEHVHFHIHAIVKREREGSTHLDWDNKTLLRTAHDGLLLDALRKTFAECCESAGLEIEGLRREDRSDIVERILRGKERLRRGWVLAKRKSPSIEDDLESLNYGQIGSIARLAQVAPQWSRTEGVGVIQRLVTLPRRAQSESGRDFNWTDDSSVGDRFHELMNKLYADQAEAREATSRFERLAGELAQRRADLALATWLLLNRAAAFGRFCKPKPNFSGKATEVKRVIEAKLSRIVESYESKSVHQAVHDAQSNEHEILKGMRSIDKILNAAADRAAIVWSWRSLANTLDGAVKMSGWGIDLQEAAELSIGLRRKADALAEQVLQFGVIEIPPMEKKGMSSVGARLRRSTPTETPKPPAPADTKEAPETLGASVQAPATPDQRRDSVKTKNKARGKPGVSR